MSFFDDPVPQPERVNEPRPPQPDWYGPQPGVLPGVLSEQVVVFRTDNVALFVGNFRVYPTGLMFELNLWLREPDETFHRPPFELEGSFRPGDSTDGILRFGVVLADGFKWTNLDQSMPLYDVKPNKPVVLRRGGGGGDYSWEWDYWLWPLPSDGPLTFVAYWPAHNVPESRATVDGMALRAAAAEAEVLWPSATG